MSLLSKLLGSRSKTTKVILTPEERLRLELERVNAEPPESDALLGEQERALTCFTKQEKTEMFEARRLLQLLPSMSVTAITEVVHIMERAAGKKVTKQYVHQVLYPKEPEKLFVSHSVGYKKVWSIFRDVVYDKVRMPSPQEIGAISSLKEAPATRKEMLKELKLTEAAANTIKEACEARDAYRATVTAISQLREGREVLLLGVNASRLKWIKVKLRKLGINHLLRKDDSVYPNRYLITPTKENTRDEVFSVEKWLAESLVDGIRAVDFDPLMRPFMGMPKTHEVLFGKTFPVYHVLGSA